MTSLAPTPPQDLVAEESVLGAMMLSPKAVEKVLVALEPDGEKKFYRGSHGVIYQTIRSLHQQGVPSDAITTVAELRNRGIIEEAGGIERLHELAALVPSASNAGHYAQIVNEQWARRLVLAKITEVEQQVREGASVGESLAALDGAVMDVRSLVDSGKTSVISSRDMAAYLREKLANPIDDDQGIATPFPRRLKRMRPGRLYVLGGYMKDGKTAVSVQFLRAAADIDGLIRGEEKRAARVGFCSMEMSWEDLTDRTVASFGVPYWQAQTGRIEPPYQASADRAMRQMERWAVDIIDDAELTVSKLIGYQRAGGYDYLIIDHLHRFSFNDRRELEQIISGIVNVSRRFEIPVLLLAQLRRSSDPKKPFPVPTMAQLRETGMTEAEAAAVWFVWRKRDEEHLTTNESRFIVAANRFGPPAAFDMTFKPEEVRFSDDGV